MTDWMAKFYPMQWQSLLLGTMALASQHTFITLTKRWQNLVSMLGQIDATENRTIRVPADKAFRKALLRANTNQAKYDFSKGRLKLVADLDLAQVRPVKTPVRWELEADLPWLPRNIVFGISVCTVEEAEKAVPFLTNIRAAWPEVKLAISQEPALDAIDWQKFNLMRGVVDLLIWGGESGPDARPAHTDGWFYARDWAQKTGTPIHFKQTGNVLAREFGLRAPKGDDLNEANLRSAFGPVQEYLDMAGRLV